MLKHCGSKFVMDLLVVAASCFVATVYGVSAVARGRGRGVVTPSRGAAAMAGTSSSRMAQNRREAEAAQAFAEFIGRGRGGVKRSQAVTRGAVRTSNTAENPNPYANLSKREFTYLKRQREMEILVNFCHASIF